MRWLVFIALLVGCAVERESPTCTDCVAQGVHPADYKKSHIDDVERRGWDLPLCQSCHGQDFAGKGNAPSCLGCHENKPTACTTCHENPPTTAAHTTHLAKGFACTDCHDVPATWEAHRKPTSRTALVTFGALAKSHGAMPSWDGAKCSNAYCHGAAQPIWKGGAEQATCGSCHGTPPASHALSQCATCHPSTSHVDGVVDLKGGGACNGCHGEAQTPAPTSGAHRAHLAGGALSPPVACTECHRVPTQVTDPGHIDSATPQVTFGTLARTGGATPMWDRASGTCASVYCHGTAQPAWNGGAAQVACGSCHGLPPTSTPHTQAMTLADCATCHPSSTGTHMNGVVDAN